MSRTDYSKISVSYARSEYQKRRREALAGRKSGTDRYHREWNAVMALMAKKTLEGVIQWNT